MFENYIEENILLNNQLISLINLSDALTLVKNSADEKKSKKSFFKKASEINDYYHKTLQLPCGRYGNVLAYLIEMQRFYAAGLLLIENVAGLDTEKIAVSPINDRDEFTVKDILDISLAHYHPIITKPLADYPPTETEHFRKNKIGIEQILLLASYQKQNLPNEISKSK